jgi:hypothetical protein
VTPQWRLLHKWSTRFWRRPDVTRLAGKHQRDQIGRIFTNASGHPVFGAIGLRAHSVTTEGRIWIVGTQLSWRTSGSAFCYFLFFISDVGCVAVFWDQNWRKYLNRHTYVYLHIFTYFFRGGGGGGGLMNIFFVQQTKTGKNITKWPQNIPNCHKNILNCYT